MTCPKCNSPSWDLNGDCTECGTHYEDAATDDDIEDIATSITDLMVMLSEKGMTSIDQMNMCHGCGRMIIDCTCEDCNCTMHKKLQS